MFQPIFFRNVAIALAILSAADAVISAVFAAFFPVGYFADKPMTRIVSDLAFIEGASLFFLGAILAFLRYRLTSRAVALMVIGASMMGISVVFGMIR